MNFVVGELASIGSTGPECVPVLSEAYVAALKALPSPHKTIAIVGSTRRIFNTTFALTVASRYVSAFTSVNKPQQQCDDDDELGDSSCLDEFLAMATAWQENLQNRMLESTDRVLSVYAVAPRDGENTLGTLIILDVPHSDRGQNDALLVLALAVADVVSISTRHPGVDNIITDRIALALSLATVENGARKMPLHIVEHHALAFEIEADNSQLFADTVNLAKSTRQTREFLRNRLLSGTTIRCVVPSEELLEQLVFEGMRCLFSTSSNSAIGDDPFVG